MALRTATNPKTGDRIALINGQWVPYSRSATNPETKQKAVFVNGRWYTDSGAAPAAPPQEEESGFFRQTLDLPVKGAQGIATGIRLVSDAFGADNPVSQNIRGVENYLQSLLSAQSRKDEQEVSRIMKEAEDKGVADQVLAGLRAFQVAPLDTIAQAAGTIAPVLVGGLATAALRLPAVAGTVGVGATMGAGTTKSAIYDATYEVLRENGASDEEARERAAQAQEYSGRNLDQILIGTVIGGVTGRFGAEDVVARKLSKDIARRSLAKTAGQEAATEFVQAGQEQVAANIAQQREGFDVPTFRGAVGAGTLEALAGAGVGAGVEAIGRPRGEMPTTREEAPPPPPPPATTVTAPPPAPEPAVTTQTEPARPARMTLQEKLDKISTPDDALIEIARLENRLAIVSETMATPESLASLAKRTGSTVEDTYQRLQERADTTQTELGLYKQKYQELLDSTQPPPAPPVEPIPQTVVPQQLTTPAPAPQAVQIDQPLAKQLNLPQAQGVPATQQVTVQAGATQQLELPGVPSAAAATTPQIAQPTQPPATGGGVAVPPSGPPAAGPSIEGTPAAGVEPVARTLPDVTVGEAAVQPALEPAPAPAPVEAASVSAPAPTVPEVPTLREDATDAEVKAYYEAMRARDEALGIGKPKRRRDRKAQEEVEFQRGYNPQIETPQFKKWFGDSKAVDQEGRPLILYRGAIGERGVPEGALEGRPRQGYATFASSSPEVAASYGQPDFQFEQSGAITPLYVKADKLIEFPVQTDRYGSRRFDKFEFDKRAQRLRPGEVLVARQVVDYGPRANIETDPKRLYSYPSDIYAWGEGTSVKSAVGNIGAFDTESESTIAQRGVVGAGVPIERARSIVDETSRGWTNAPKIVVANNANDPAIPANIQEQIPADARGVYSNGTVYIISDRAEDEAGIRGTVFHESLGHFGLRQVFGSRLDNILTDIYNTNPQTKRAADALIQQYPDLTPARAVNEVLAQKSEAGPIKEAGLRAAFNRVAAFVRRVGRTVGIRINYSNNDVAQVLAQAHRRVTKGKPSAPVTAKVARKEEKQVLDLPTDEVDAREPLTKRQMQGFKDAYNTVEDFLRRPMLGLQSLPELVDLYKNEVPTLQGLLDVVNEKAYSIKERLLGVDRNVRRWADILKKHPKQIQKFYSIALESTRLQIDFDSAADADKPLTKEFNALPDDLKTVYREMRKSYEKMADEYLEIITKNLPPTVANEFRKQYEEKRLKVYFPLYREGKYWLRYEQDGEAVVRAFQSRRARTLAQRDAIKEGARNFQPYEKIEDVLSDPQAGFGFYSKAMDALETHYQSTYGTPAPLILKQNLYEMFLDTIPAASVRQQFRKREGYLGAERDLLGVYATMAPRMMNQLNNLEFNPKLDEVTNLVNEDVEKAQSISANDLKQEVQARLEFLRDPTNSKLVNFGVFFSYFDYIIGNISSAVANLTNLPMSVYPVLAGKHGYDKTALAMEDATKMWFKGGWDNDGAEGIPNRWPSDRTAFADLPKNSPLSRLFDRAVRENALKHSVAYDLLEARGQRMELQAGFLSTLSGTNDYMGFWNKTKQGLGWVFQNTERFNREVALIAAFNLEMEKGASEKDAIKYAVDIVNQTNGVTLSEIGPRFFQTGILKVALTFKNFARTQLYLQYKLLRDMLKGAEIKTEGLSPEEAEKARAINNEFRKVATKQWLGTLAGAFTFAGIQGLPFYGALTVLASLTDDDDEPMDPDERVKQAVGSLAYKGPVNQLTMADVASRTGFNGMLWREDPKRMAEVGRVLYTLEQLMGPAYGSIRSRISAYDDFVNGYTDRALEKTMPLFVRNMLKSYRYATDGVLTKEKDARITEDPDSYELFMQFAGFSPARISEAMARSGARKEIEKKFEQRREALLQNYYNAWVVNDQEGVQDALEAIDKHNESKMAKELNYYIDKKTILRSRQERLRRANESLEGMSYSRRMTRGLEEMVKE